MTDILRKTLLAVVLLCFVFMPVSIYAEENPEDSIMKTKYSEEDLYETFDLSQEASASKVISGDLLFDDGYWSLSLSGNEPKTAELLYKDAALYRGNTYDVLMNITASSDDYAEILISNRELDYRVNDNAITENDGNRIANLAEEYATHEPRYNYVLGGRDLSSESGKGLDCAHFVGRVYEDCGYPEITASGADANVNHLHDDLADKAVNDIIENGPAKLDQMRRGDILIFYKNGHPSHTAIYIGGGKIAHAMDEDNGVCVIDMKYNEETGVVGYNGKTLQRVIRPARTTTVTADANVTIDVQYTIVDKNKNAIGGIDVGAVVEDKKGVTKTPKTSEAKAPKNNKGYYVDNSTIYEKVQMKSTNKESVKTKLNVTVPEFRDYKEWSRRSPSIGEKPLKIHK